MTQLFKAWSVVDKFHGQEQVMFNWFVVGRTTPVLSYDELIENYDETDDEAWCDQILVNEYFTRAEAEELRNYLLKAHQLEVQTEEIRLPVRAGELSYGLRLINGVEGFYNLADEEGYKLSVSVLGYFDIKEEQLSPVLSYEDMQIGTCFLEKVFSYLNISLTDNRDFSNLLDRIYEETGLCVRRDQKKSKRLINSPGNT